MLDVTWKFSVAGAVFGVRRGLYSPGDVSLDAKCGPHRLEVSSWQKVVY